MKQNNMRIIGITGGVGAGKSTVLDYLEQKHKACVFQADQIGHLVMEPGQSCYQPVLDLFGKEARKEDGTIDRRYLSELVFSQPKLLEKLNRIIHPAVKTYIRGQLESKRQQGQALCVVEAALLLQDGYQEFCDTIWYIHTDQQIRIQRLMDSRGYTRKKCIEIMENQATEEFFRSHADFVIENSGSEAETWRQIEEGIKRDETL